MSEQVILRSEDGREAALSIAAHNGKTEWGPDKIPTLTRDDADTLQLLEEIEYEFTIGDGVGVGSIQPTEVFNLSNDKSGGRVRPGGRTGLVRVDLSDTSGVHFTGEIEVRSRKLDYLTEYRWMLDRIASEASELALSPFAATHLSSLGTDHTQSPETLYQRFEFLRSRVTSAEFRSAIEQLRHRPHTSFEEQREVVPISKPVRGGRSLSRQLTKPGPREPFHRSIGPVDTLPRTIERVTHEETRDTVPNRFVRYVTEEWLALLDGIEKVVLRGGKSKNVPAPERAEHEIMTVRALLEDVQRMPAVREAGRLTQFPSSNTVVRSRSGYREFLSAFQDTNALAHLQWDEAEDSMSAGQHDVPTLYEYWVFLEVARLVGELGFDVQKEALLSVSNSGLKLELRKANEVVVRARGRRNDVDVELELWFNKSFSYQAGSSIDADRSWSVQMRPDVSLSIKPIGVAHAEKTWVHFDAKYKISHTNGFKWSEGESGNQEAKPEDLQKMHAYRDAIRRSAGAYVLYPGNNSEHPERYQEYHELLPGLGAFALRPVNGGMADEVSAGTLQRFIEDVIDHLTFQGTSYQRDRYWRSEVHTESGYGSSRREFLDRPPADTAVLLGYLRSGEHEAAVHSLGVYNMRADPGRDGAVDVRAPELGAELLVLYGQGTAKVYRATGDVVLRKRAQLEVEGYDPRSEVYLCLPFEPEVLMELDEAAVWAKADRGGAPVGVVWSDIETDRKELRSDSDD